MREELERYTLGGLIQGHEEQERAIVFVPNGDKSMLMFVGMSREEMADYLIEAATQVKQRVEIEDHLRRIAGSERKQ